MKGFISRTQWAWWGERPSSKLFDEKNCQLGVDTTTVNKTTLSIN